jgi:hypothetical protein
MGSGRDTLHATDFFGWRVRGGSQAVDGTGLERR